MPEGFQDPVVATVDVPAHFGAELQRLDAMAEDGLVRIDADGVDVTDAGWYVVRAVAMVFDRYLRQPPSRGDDGAQPVRFSRVL